MIFKDLVLSGVLTFINLSINRRDINHNAAPCEVLVLEYKLRFNSEVIKRDLLLMRKFKG